jgi:hypothetical protein
MIFVCAACGRPRVPSEQPTQRSGAERAPLAKAEADLKSAVVATGLAILGFVVSSALLGAAALSFALGASGLALMAFVVALLTAGAGGFGVLTSRNAKRRADEQMREAFGAAALDVMRERGTISAAQLAQALGVPEGVAERALTRLPARSDVRVDTVLDDRAADGQLRYRIADAPVPADPLDEGAEFEARLRAASREQR